MFGVYPGRRFNASKSRGLLIAGVRLRQVTPCPISSPHGWFLGRRSSMGRATASVFVGSSVGPKLVAGNSRLLLDLISGSIRGILPFGSGCERSSEMVFSPSPLSAYAPCWAFCCCFENKGESTSWVTMILRESPMLLHDLFRTIHSSQMMIPADPGQIYGS